MLPELVNQLSHRAVLETEPLGDFRLRTPLNKHGAQRLVTTVIRMGGLGEELPTAGVIHDQCSLEMSVGFAGQTKEDGKVKLSGGRCKSRQSPGKCSD